jgi:hypothetical protein
MERHIRFDDRDIVLSNHDFLTFFSRLGKSILEVVASIYGGHFIGATDFQRSVGWLVKAPETIAFEDALDDAALRKAWESLWESANQMIEVDKRIMEWLMKYHGLSRRTKSKYRALSNRLDSELARATHNGKFPPEWTQEPEYQKLLGESKAIAELATLEMEKIEQRVKELLREA